MGSLSTPEYAQRLVTAKENVSNVMNLSPVVARSQDCPTALDAHMMVCNTWVRVGQSCSIPTSRKPDISCAYNSVDRSGDRFSTVVVLFLMNDDLKSSVPPPQPLEETT